LNQYPSRTKSEWRLIDKNPFGDTDKDKVLNFFDCKPKNKMKQEFGAFKYRGNDRAREVESFTAAERFGGANIKRLKKLGAGRDRIVYQLDKDKVLKIAKNPGGLRQNQYEGDYYINDSGFRPKYYESGKDYVVMEKVGKLSPANKRKFREITKKMDWKKSSGEVVEELNKRFDPEYTGEDSGKFSDLGNYDISPGDITKPSSWGEKEGQVILIDAGGLSSDSINTVKNPHNIKRLKQFKEQLLNVDKERKYSNRAQVAEQEIQEWSEIQTARKQFKKKGEYAEKPYDPEQKLRKGMPPTPDTLQSLDEKNELNLDDFRESDDDEYAVDKMAGYKAAKEAEREAYQDSESAISEFQSKT
jgi:hypothetical protein